VVIWRRKITSASSYYYGRRLGMNDAYPFVYKFRTNKNGYVYDVNTNNILRVTDDVYKEIDTKPWSNRQIRDAFESGIISNKRPLRIIPAVSFKKMKEVLQGDIQKIILFVADYCNLSCSYCYYSDIYERSKNLNGKFMDWDIAKEAIDFYLQHSKDDKGDEKAICFYGGEPFLNFEVIQKSVEYIRSKRGWIVVAISTNLTLLDKDILDFLIDNRIHLSVSLDGPEELHDRYRIFKNGKGSFGIVLKNLKKIYERDMEYFYNFVIFNVTAAPPIDYTKIHDFFSSSKLFSKSWYANIGKISFTGGPRFKDKYGFDRNEGEETEEKLFERFRGKIVNEGRCKDRFLLRFYYPHFWKIYNRLMVPLPSLIKERNACIPGQLRLLVAPDGDLYPCEKGISTIKIGCLDGGFDFEKCYELIREYTKIRTELCRDCWAIRFCNTCYLGAEKDGKMDKEVKKEECTYVKKHWGVMLKRFAEIMEERPDAFSESRKLIKMDRIFLL